MRFRKRLRFPNGIPRAPIPDHEQAFLCIRAQLDAEFADMPAASMTDADRVAERIVVALHTEGLLP